MSRYYNHYEKFTEAIKLKCGYDFDYIFCKKIIGNSNYNVVIFVIQITFLELVVVQ